MGIIINTVEIVDLNNYTPEYYNCLGCGEEVEKHLIQDGAYFHVLWYGGKGIHCMKKKFEINHKCKGKTLEVKL